MALNDLEKTLIEVKWMYYFFRRRKMDFIAYHQNFIETALHKRIVETGTKFAFISEILTAVSLAKTVPDKIDILRKNCMDSLMTFLYYVYDPTIEFDITPEEAKALMDPSNTVEKKGFLYKPDNAPETISVMPQRKLKILIDSQIPKERKLDYIKEWFQYLHPTEVDLIVMMFERKLNPIVKGMTIRLVREAFPNLLSNPKDSEGETDAQI